MIPIYRAKKKDSNEWVEGAFDGNSCILTSEFKTVSGAVDGEYKCYRYERIDTSTLAIYFPKKNMFDKNGKRIFISLNNGKGGDISSESGMALTIDDFPIYGYEFEVIGIHKG